MTDWENIVAEQGTAVWGRLWRLLGNRADVDDCFQECFLAALRASRREQVRSWSKLLGRIATARAMDQLRKRYRNTVAEAPGHATEKLPEEHYEIESAAPGPVENAETTELIEHLRVALAHLPPEQAEVFALQTFEGWNRREIAGHLDMTESAVGVSLHRARKRLRVLMKDFAEPSRMNTQHIPKGEPS